LRDSLACIDFSKGRLGPNSANERSRSSLFSTCE
jgi:hypothetical protein